MSWTKELEFDEAHRDEVHQGWAVGGVSVYWKIQNWRRIHDFFETSSSYSSMPSWLNVHQFCSSCSLANDCKLYSDQQVWYHRKLEMVEGHLKYLMEMDEINVQKMSTLSDIHAVFWPRKTFPSYILHFLSNELQHETLLEIGRPLIESMWSTT